MNSIMTFEYNKQIIDRLREWHYGMNWPIVYIYYNDNYAYVGETLDAVRRTEQHMLENQFNQFDKICFISNKTFNKSVILDLESFLIKYISADGTKKLINGNAGVVNHNYFYKEAYEDDFKDIWKHLQTLGIVNKSIIDIENSELYKYSPYKTLNSDQLKASYEILKRLCEINNASSKSIIEVVGGAGTGKTILAVYLIKLIMDINNQKEIWKSIDDPEDAEYIKHLATKFSGIKEVGFVVPMNQLRNTIKSIFNSIDGLSDELVYSPEEVYKKHFDLLVVDEAHRLYRRKNLPGSHLYLKFDKINKEIMAEKFTGTESDFTELDWIIQSSRMQILFYDDKQAIRTTDIGKDRFEEICRPRLYKYIELFSQMRCLGGNGYYEYIRKILFDTNIRLSDFQRIQNYDLRIVDTIDELCDYIVSKNKDVGLSKLLTGPGWKIGESILIENKKFHWANKSNDDAESIYSIHKIQGFDLNYSGVIFGKEIYYDTQSNSIEINKSELMDNFTKSSGDIEMKNFILNIYLTLMTRAIHGTCVYVEDLHLREYLKQFIM